MPSFLSKVFGRKKDDKESPRRVADTELLDGKFESVSPSATKFPEVANERQPRHKERDSPFHVFRSRSRPSSPESKDRRAEVPHLSLNLPGLKDEEVSRDLGVVFDADPESQILSEEAIGRRRLNPLETLILVRACSEAIIARGLETLGIMHPHWYSASPEEQRRIISLFLRSLAPKASVITPSTAPCTIATMFNSAISSTKSPYDVAAVLRWGLRHLQLEGTSFGKDGIWYKTFFDAERSAGWPPNGYSSTLAPLLPTSHLELLTATLELFSSLAAHAEVNGISGSKLSKFFGLWLLTVERTEKDDDWSTFYARWERTGRMLEHLFLSRIRDDATESRMPTRLLELIQRYPYQTDPNADLLARPRFSTIQYDALFVRIETELSATADQPSHHPLRIISEAFKAEASFDASEHAAIWESIKKSGSVEGSFLPGEYPGLSHIFSDETLRFFSLVPMDTGSSAAASPSFNLYTQPSLPASSSLSDKDAASTTVAAGSSPPKHSKTPTSPISPSDVNSPIGPDWITFSTSGFLDDSAERPPLASTLMEKERDMEVTIPRPSSPRLSLFNSRKSSDRPRTPAKSEVPKPSPPSAVLSPVKTVSRSTHVSLVQLDEAFVDFWSDALLDPISSSWPAFIICKLKNVETGVDGKRIEWLVLEQAFKRPPPPTPEASTSSHSHESPSRMRTSSPNSSTSDSSFMFSSMFKKIGFLTSPAKAASSLPHYKEGTKKRKGKEKAVGPMVGEMGEILREEDEGKGKTKGKKEKEKKDETVRVRVPSPKPKKSVEASRQSVIAAVKKSIDEGSKTNGVVAGSMAAGAAVAVGGAVAVAAGVSEADKAKEPVPALAEDSTTGGAPVESVASAIPEEVPAPAPVKEAIPQEETPNGCAAVQTNEPPSTVAEPRVLFVADSVQSPPVVSEPEAVQTVVDQAKAAEMEVVSVPPAEEAKPIEHVAEPTIVETIKEPETEVAPATAEAKTPEHQAASVVEDIEPGVVPVVEETKVLQSQFTPVVEETKVPEAVSVVEETKAAELIVEETRTPEPELVPAVKEPQVLRSETVPVVEEVKASEDKAVSVVEDVKAPESVVEEAEVSAPVVEGVNPSGPLHDAKPLEVAPVIEETKVSEPEVIAESKAFEPEVVPPIDEVKTRELEVAPISEEIKAPAHEAAPVVEDIKPVEVKPVMEEVEASDLEGVSTVEEVKVLEHEVAPPFEEKKTHELEILPAVDEVKASELEVTPIVEDTKVPEHEVVPAVQEIKTAGVETVPAEKEIEASEDKVIPTVEEVKVPKPEIAPVVEGSRTSEPEVEPEAVEVKPAEREVAPTTEVFGPAMEETATNPDLTPVVGEVSVISEAQEQVANETTIKDVVDEQREIEAAAVIPAKELFAEPLVRAEVPQSEPAVESQTPVERALEPDTEVLQVEEKSEPVVGKIVEPVVEDVAKPVGEETSKSVAVEVNEPIAPEPTEPVAKSIVEGTAELVSEPIIEEAVQPIVTEVHDIVVQVAEPVVDIEKPVAEKPVQPLGPESRQDVVEEPVEPAKPPVVEETLGSAAQPAVEEVAVTLVEEEAHGPSEEIVVPARVNTEPVINEIAEPETVLDESATDDKVVEPEKVVSNEEVPVEKHVEDALVEGGSGSVEAVVIKEEASPEVPMAEDVKTSVEEAPVSAIEGKPTPIVESIAEEPFKAIVEEEIFPASKESAEVSAAIPTEVIIPASEEVKEEPSSAAPVSENDVEDTPAPTREVAPVVEKSGSPVLDSEAVPMPMKVVAKEESPSIEHDIVKAKEESSPQVALEVVETSQEKPVVEDTVTSESESVPPVVETTIGKTLEPVTVPAVEEHAPVVKESVAAVNESASVVGLEKADVQEAVSEQSAPVVEDIKDSTTPVEKVEVSAVEEFDAERSTLVKADSSPASDTVEPENAVTKEITPEEPTSSATRSENAVEPTKQTSAPTQEEAHTSSVEEHTVSVAEPEHPLEIHAPVQSVPSTDAAQEEMGVHAQTNEVVPTAEEPVPITVESEVKAEHETPIRTEEILTGVEELTPAAAEPELEVKTLEAETVPTTVNQTIEDFTPIVKESALPVPVVTAPVAADKPAESTDVVEPKETLVSKEEVAPIIEEPAPEPEIGVIATEVESLPIADEPEKKSAETVELLENTTAPAATVEEREPSVQAPAAPVEAEGVQVATGHTVKETTDIANAESAGGENSTERTPVHVFEIPVTEEAVPDAVELEPKPEAHHPPALAAAGQHMEESIVGGNSTEVSAPIEATPIVEEHAPSPEAAAETKAILVAQNEPDHEGALVTHAADETSMRTEEEVIVNVTKEPIAEEPTTSATESRAQAEAPAHTNTEPTPTVEEKDSVESKDAIPAPIVEVATEHLVPNQAPVSSQIDAPATVEVPIQKPVIIESAADTSFPIAEKAPSILEEHTASVDRELAVSDIVESSQTANEAVNEPSAIAVGSTAASVPVPVTEGVPAPLADEVKPLAVESEPVLETLAPVAFEPVLAVTEESIKGFVPVVEHAPSTEISTEEVPTIKKDTVPVEAAIVEEKPAKVEVPPVVQDITENSNPVHEISNISVLKDDTIVVTVNANGHSAAVKEEAAVSVQVPGTSATESTKE